MKTFTQMKNDAAAYCGLYPDAPEMIKLVNDINTGAKLFQSAARRYWTESERQTNLVAGQQYYQFPSDMLRVTSVKVKIGERYSPIIPTGGEEWDSLNGWPQQGSPQYFCIKGPDVIGLYPTPGASVDSGLLVTFEPRVVDMAIEDITPTVKVTEGSNVVESTAGDSFNKHLTNNCWFKTTDGSDGNWYKVAKYIDDHHIQLDNYYQGPSELSARAVIGQSPQFPEEYHDAPVYYACQQFFVGRKDLESASFFGQQFDKLMNEYRRVYGNPLTSGAINRTGVSRGIGRVFPGILRG